VTSGGKSDPPKGWLSALDANTGKIRWQYHSDSPIVAGITPTAGGVVLTGDAVGNLLVFDSARGQLLYKKDTGGGIAGGVITYAIDGRQYIAFTSGNGSRSFFGRVGPPSIIVMALDEATWRSAAASQAGLGQGRQLYGANCSGCRGVGGGGGPTAPPLEGVRNRRTFEQTVEWIKDPKPAMPRLYPRLLDDKAVRDVATFIRTF